MSVFLSDRIDAHYRRIRAERRFSLSHEDCWAQQAQYVGDDPVERGDAKVIQEAYAETGVGAAISAYYVRGGSLAQTIRFGRSRRRR